MRSNYAFYILALAAGSVASSCSPEIEKPSLDKGTADFTKYVAVGNSLTAGYSNGGLYEAGQLVSYPNLIAQQMKLVGGGDFQQPIMAGNGSGYLTLKGISAVGLPILDTADPNIALVERVYSPTLVEFKDAENQATLNNLGVPGISVSQITLPGLGLSNPTRFNYYYERMIGDDPTSTGLTTYLSFASRSNPTFFTNWLGNNDVLQFALEGGSGVGLTPLAEFRTKYTQIVDSLTRNGAKGMLATIPNVTSAPYFTTIPYNPLPLSAEQAQLAQFGYSVAIPPSSLSYNAGVRATNAFLPEGQKLDTVRFSAGLNAPIIYDSADVRLAQVGFRRQLKQGEALVLSVPTSRFAQGYGTASPINMKYVLTATELAAIKIRTDEINAFIKELAGTKGLALFDANAFLDRVKSTGIVNDGIATNAAFISGGAFSLDGIHLTPRGNALVANEMIKAINATYKSSIPMLNISQFPGVTFPQ